MHAPSDRAVVVYYGTPPKTSGLEKVRAPIVGLPGGADGANFAPAKRVWTKTVAWRR